MSDVLIKNIQIPKDNKRLALFIDKDGEVTVFEDNEFVRISDAIEVPPHGRLIDADRLFLEAEQFEMQDSWGDDLWIHVDDLKNAPTIIEASKEGE